MKLGLPFLLWICAFVAVAQPKKSADQDSITFEVIHSPQGTFGYDIYKNGKRLIHQPTVPGQSGTAGFLKKADAEKVARFVIRKLQKGEMPPTVTRKDLEDLNAI